MKIKSKFCCFTIVFLCLILLSGCGKKKSIAVPVKTPEIPIKTKHQWYSFTNTGYIKIEKPQNAQSLAFLPWTEAIRVSSANNATDEDTGNKAFAIVNQLGVLSFDNDKITLSKDINLFNDRTAGNLVFLDNVPVFSVYKSSFFNSSIANPVYTNDGNQHLFLLQYDELAGVCYPLVNCNNIVEETNSEITDFYWDGFDFICSVKTLYKDKSDFSYVKWHPTVPLLTISPNNANNNIVVKNSSVGEFRKAKELLEYEKSPDRIKKLLSGFSAKIPYVITVKAAGGSSERMYYNQVNNPKAKELNAKAIISKSWSAALFEDGTLFIEGALPGKHILRGGKPVAIRLPKLPAGYVYSDFVVSGSNLYAAWEETSFYKTSCAGFIRVDLDATLYSQIR